jgi:hypothetical protein
MFNKKLKERVEELESKLKKTEEEIKNFKESVIELKYGEKDLEFFRDECNTSYIIYKKPEIEFLVNFLNQKYGTNSYKPFSYTVYYSTSMLFYKLIYNPIDCNICKIKKTFKKGSK